MKMQTKMKAKAQSIIEYALLLGIIGLALGAMQLYFKRGIQAAIKVSVDQLGSQEGSSLKEPDQKITGTSVEEANTIETSTRSPAEATFNRVTTSEGSSTTTVIQRKATEEEGVE